MEIIIGFVVAVLSFFGMKFLSKRSVEKSRDTVNVLKGRREEIAKDTPPTEVPKLDDQQVVDYWKDKV